jgi:hypothetical protein
MSLLTDLRSVAATSLEGSELPTHTEVESLVGAVIKTLDAAGITVAKDLLPAQADEIAEPAIVAAGTVAEDDARKLLAELEALKAKFLGSNTAAAPTLAAPATPTVPTSTVPAAPPIEGAS